MHGLTLEQATSVQHALDEAEAQDTIAFEATLWAAHIQRFSVKLISEPLEGARAPRPFLLDQQEDRDRLVSFFRETERNARARADAIRASFKEAR